MKNFVFVNTEENFEYVPKGSKVILGEALYNEKNIKSVKDQGFSVWIEINKVRKISVCSITDFAGRTEKEKGTVYAVTKKSFENILLACGKSLDYIDGFILPAPKLCGALWNKSLQNLIDRVGEIYDIFDEDVMESYARSLYYESIEKQLISRYIKPVCKIANIIGKSVCFGMKGKIQYDFLPFINPMRLICDGIPVVFKDDSPEIESLRGLMNKTKEKILVIKPVRGARMKYVQTNTRSKVRLENPALCASYEGTYFCDRLNALTKSFTAVDEYILEECARVEKEKIKLFEKSYEQVIICDGCRFTKKGTELIETIKNSGILVNSRELLRELYADVMEE